MIFAEGFISGMVAVVVVTAGGLSLLKYTARRKPDVARKLMREALHRMR